MYLCETQLSLLGETGAAQSVISVLLQTQRVEVGGGQIKGMYLTGRSDRV